MQKHNNKKRVSENSDLSGREKYNERLLWGVQMQLEEWEWFEW